MATITAKGPTRTGEQEVRITGGKRVGTVECKDGAFRQFVETSINQGVGQMANGYMPPAGTMLQALAVLQSLYLDYRDITVNGDIGTIPGDPDVIY